MHSKEACQGITCFAWAELERWQRKEVRVDEFYCCLAWALAKESADRVRAEHLSHLHAEVQKQVGRSGSQTSRAPGFWRRDGRRMNRGGDADDKKPVAADEETYLLKRMRWNVRRKTNRMMGPANLCGLKQLFCQLVARDRCAACFQHQPISMDALGNKATYFHTEPLEKGCEIQLRN